MDLGLTRRAAQEYDHICYGSMTPEMAAQYLSDGNIQIRSFSEILQDLYPCPDLQLRLVNGLQACEPDISQEAIVRKVHNWVSGKNNPSSREDIFKISFTLGLSEAQCNLLLGVCMDYGLHYREGRDVVYAWFLRKGYDYLQARQFFESLPPVPDPFGFPTPSESRSDRWGRGMSQIHVTRDLMNEFYGVHTVEQLRETYLQNLPNFGQLHVRAYQYFEKYMKLLTSPASDWYGMEEENYSLETVMEQYLSMHMPARRSRAGLTAVQKLLKQNWPNATALKNIQAHRADVPRKLLLILYVVTGNVVDEDYDEMDEGYLTIQDRLENHWWVLNAILKDCGMPSLDPRNVTDWLVLYALTADDDESMSERMEQVIQRLF